MPVPTDPVQLVLLALVLWGFWAACVRHDLIAQRRAKTSRLAGAVPDSSTPPPRGDFYDQLLQAQLVRGVGSDAGKRHVLPALPAPKRRTSEGGARG